jgi:hypothetical protein
MVGIEIKCCSQTPHVIIHRVVEEKKIKHKWQLDIHEEGLLPLYVTRAAAAAATKSWE